MQIVLGISVLLVVALVVVGIKRLRSSAPKPDMVGKEFTLPNGLTIFNSPTSGIDLSFIYQELWLGDNFIKKSLVLNDGDTVFDVGANVGMFSIFLSKELQRKRINYHCFEPVPPTHAYCKKNLDHHIQPSSTVTLHQLGLFEKETDLAIRFYPQCTGNSTLFPESKGNMTKERAQEVIANMLVLPGTFNKLLWVLLHIPFIYPFRFSIVHYAENQVFKSFIEYNLHLKTLSQMIDETKVDHIHLLKVDTEGAEVPCLRGIRDEHWGMINQISMELEDNRAEVEALLTKKGFTLQIEQDPLQKGTDIYNLFATRKK